jgi:hypothetical protein
MANGRSTAGSARPPQTEQDRNWLNLSFSRPRLEHTVYTVVDRIQHLDCAAFKTLLIELKLPDGWSLGLLHLEYGCAFSAISSERCFSSAIAGR